jgi:NADH:ubiquinone oxidoreductase subunit K
MDKRTSAIVMTVAATLLCACPGLFGLCMGGMFALLSFVPGAQIDVLGSSDPQSALTFGLGILCVGALSLAIGVAAIVIVWRRRKEEAVPPAL